MSFFRLTFKSFWHWGVEKSKTLKANRIPELETVPWTPLIQILWTVTLMGTQYEGLHNKHYTANIYFYPFSRLNNFQILSSNLRRRTLFLSFAICFLYLFFPLSLSISPPYLFIYLSFNLSLSLSLLRWKKKFQYPILECPALIYF